MASSIETSSKKLRTPKLTRLILIRVDARHRPAEKVGKLLAKIGREAKVLLFLPDKDYDFCRIKVEIKIKGDWKDDIHSQPIMSFSGEYEGRFIYPKDAAVAEAEEWLESELNRQCMVAQVFPLANSHMYSQLAMMGLNPNGRALGFDFDSTEQSPVVTGAKKRSKRNKLR